MKKIYQQPNIEVVKVEQQLLDDVSAQLDSTQSITNTSDFGSREYDDWDE